MGENKKNTAFKADDLPEEPLLTGTHCLVLAGVGVGLEDYREAVFATLSELGDLGWTLLPPADDIQCGGTSAIPKSQQSMPLADLIKVRRRGETGE